MSREVAIAGSEIWDGAPRWADLQRVSIRYTLSGDSGRPVLLLHEMGGSLESWDPVLALMPRGQRVVRCDMRGGGGSESIRAETTCGEMADDIGQLLEYLDMDEPVDVAGCAIGGCLGLMLAARHPHLVHRLAAINPPVDVSGRAGEVLRERAVVADTAGMRALAASAMARSYPEILRATPQEQKAYEAYVARFITNDPTSYAFILRALVNVDFNGVLGRIACPTLLVAGTHDMVRPPPTTQAVVPLVEGASYLEIGGGHIPAVQAPGAVVQALGGFFNW